MAHDYKQLVKEIVLNAADGQRVTVCTATEKVTLMSALVYERDETILDARSVDDRGVLIPGSAIQVVYFDEDDDED